ncbi:glutamate racemase [Candidatus Parcubacteria bacterium]|nr:MAG: glutamate racemase [Candidatus Parcubacteria bacterium]
MIGVFDSGLGGLSVLKELQNKLPDYSYLYLGDSLNAPYGNLGAKTIYKLTKTALDFMFSKGAVLVLVACNSVSVETVRKLQEDCYNSKHSNKKILGIIIPTVENISQKCTKNSAIALIGTKQTIHSNKYKFEILKRRKDMVVYPHATPRLAGLIEKGDEGVVYANIRKELSYFKKMDYQYFLLACTHYSFYYDFFKKELPNNIKLFNSSFFVAEKTAEYLKKHSYLPIKKNKSTTIYTTGDLDKFKNRATALLENTNKREIKYLKTSIFTNNCF